MKEHIADLIQQSLNSMMAEGILPNDLHAKIHIEQTKDKSHGDLASNIALTLAKAAGKAPREIAQIICDSLPKSGNVSKTEIAGPGFINFFLSAASSQQVVKTILEQGKVFGTNNSGAGKKVQVEFVSANPTGPLHIGHGRGAAVGDCICRLLEATGWDVTREFYYNDAGAQINNLALSVQARAKGINPDSAEWAEADWYKGEYIADVATAYMHKHTVHAADLHVHGKGDPDDIEAIREFAVAYLRHEQDQDLQAFKTAFDVYFLESSLYAEGKVEETVTKLVENGHTYEKEGALWLKTTNFGDDKDRVMRKSDGGYTYFVPDVAYHINKWNRGFTKVINEQGSDHHSTITRVRAGLQAAEMGIPEGWPDYVLHQMVTVMKGGEEVKISKRAGSYVTLRDLIEEVGCDATRYFLAARSPSSQLTFDIDLARSQSNENPVYYIQYAHARVCSMMRKLEEHNWHWAQEDGFAALEKLDQDAEKAVIKQLSAYPEVITRAATEAAPHVLANFLKELAGEFHSYYNSHKMLVDDEQLRNARISLSLAVKQVLANGLELLGVSQPESM